MTRVVSMTLRRYPAGFQRASAGCAVPALLVTASLGVATFIASSPADAQIGFGRVGSGIGFRPGTRFGPREIRTFSVRYSAWGGHTPNGYWDVNQRKRFLKGMRMVDCGDVDIAYYGIERNMRLITEAVRAILARKARTVTRSPVPPWPF